jgi:tRNA pseudouridine13 synthase
VRIKQRPEDFEVTESYRFDEDPKGEWWVYLMDKQKLSTLDAMERIRETHKIKREQFSFCGLKDKQGRTKQLIAIKSGEITMQTPDLRLKLLGRTREPLSSANITSNRFSVSVRDLTQEDLDEVPASVAEVQRIGVVNYFDSQRFGSLKHGQGFIAKELIAGKFEAALKLFFATPSELDHSNDAKVKAFWRDRWGDWKARSVIPEARRYAPIVQHLQDFPQDYAGAFMKIDMRSRAMVIFAYQSWLWNECVRRYLMAVLPPESLFALPYQAGTLLFPRDAPADVLKRLRTMSFPLLGPETPMPQTDPHMNNAINWVLGREKLTVAQLKVPNVPQLFFRHELRQVMVVPGKLVIGKEREDELQPGRSKVNVAFTLPPGAYATLVTKRLFWFDLEKGRKERLVEIREAKADAAEVVRQAEIAANPAPTYREKLKRKKEQKAQARQAAQAPRPPKAPKLKPGQRPLPGTTAAKKPEYKP